MSSDTIHRQDNRSIATDTPDNTWETGFNAMTFVDAIVGNVVREIFANMDLNSMRSAMKDGYLKCFYDTWRGGQIEITTVDLDNLSTPGKATPQIKAHTESSMKDYAAVAIDSLGSDKATALLEAARSAALGDDEYLSVHEVEDYLCFAVVRPTAETSPA